MAASSTPAANRQSGRLQAVEHERVLDDVARRRRLRKQLEALEQDNFHDDPHANLQWHKKMPKFEDKNAKKKRNTDEDGEPASKKKRKIRGEHFKQRFRKNFHALLEEEHMQASSSDNTGKPSYFSAHAPSSNYPVRHFCAVCGFSSNYTCTRCGVRYCSIKCRDVHTETRLHYACHDDRIWKRIRHVDSIVAIAGFKSLRNRWHSDKVLVLAAGVTKDRR